MIVQPVLTRRFQMVLVSRMYVRFFTVNFCFASSYNIEPAAAVLQGQEQCSNKESTSFSLSQLNLKCHIFICSEFCMFCTRQSGSSEQMFFAAVKQSNWSATG